MDLDLKWYQEGAKRTMASLESQQDDIHHMNLGMFGEFGEITEIVKKVFAYGKELDKAHLAEEIGDMWWYIANFYTIIKEEFVIPNFSDFKTLALEKSKEEAVDVIISKMDPFVVAANVSEKGPGVLISMSKEIIDAFELDLESILQNNLDKLKVRYPEKFDADKAINRDLEKENKVLKKA